MISSHCYGQIKPCHYWHFFRPGEMNSACSDNIDVISRDQLLEQKENPDNNLGMCFKCQPAHKAYNLSYSDCRSEEGVTIGLIDSLISISRVLKPRLLDVKSETKVIEALKDLRSDPDMIYILSCELK